LGRGTGFRGLAGIRPARWIGDLWLASPLLGVTRQEIVRYLNDHGLAWREDHTNVDVTYMRNYIRHRLLPGLQREAHGNLIDALAGLAASATRLYGRIEREVEEAWPGLVEVGEDKVIIRAPQLASLPEIVAVELIRRAVACPAVGGSDLAELHYRGLLRLARQGSDGKELSLPGGLVARRKPEHLTLGKDRQVGCVPRTAGTGGMMGRDAHPTVVLAIPGRTRLAGSQIEAQILPWSEADSARIAGDKSPLCEYLDFDRIEPPLIVRPRRVGDRFQPLGMAGEKKVGKFLTTAQVPRNVRDRILIFADRAGIVWVCPVRIGERIKVTRRTQRVLQLTVSDTTPE
jgi:tRNA(Ile)-lysidine synthase